MGKDIDLSKNNSILKTLHDHILTLKVVGGLRFVLNSTRTDKFLHLFFHHNFLFDTKSQILNNIDMDNRLVCVYTMGDF